MRFSIVKREPSYFFENIHEDLNRFLKDTFGDFEYLDSNMQKMLQTFRPAIEIKEKNDKYKIKVELPNVKKEDIDIEVNENQISIQAESKCEKCEENENLKTTEFRYGKFSRTIPLEHKIDIDKSRSEFKDGILNIELIKQQSTNEEIKKLKIE